jgi:hypothetical protein
MNRQGRGAARAEVPEAVRDARRADDKVGRPALAGFVADHDQNLALQDGWFASMPHLPCKPSSLNEA